MQIRAAVAGVLFLDDSIAINFKQLRFLYPKCRSSINVSLAAIGFRWIPKPDFAPLRLALPIFNSFPDEIRNWSIRILDTPKPLPSTPHTLRSHNTENVDPCHSFHNLNSSPPSPSLSPPLDDFDDFFFSDEFLLDDDF